MSDFSSRNCLSELFCSHLAFRWYDVLLNECDCVYFFYLRLDGILEGEYEEDTYIETEEDFQGQFAIQGKPSYKFSTLSYVYLLVLNFKVALLHCMVWAT